MAACRPIFRADLFAGQVAVVTDGGSGIGRRTAHELASLGAAVAIVCSIHVCDIREEAFVRDTIASRPSVLSEPAPRLLGDH